LMTAQLAASVVVVIFGRSTFTGKRMMLPAMHTRSPPRSRD